MSWDAIEILIISIDKSRKTKEWDRKIWSIVLTLVLIDGL